MLGVALQIAVIVVLTVLNGLFAMSETALVSSRKARLRQRAEAGDRFELAGRFFEVLDMDGWRVDKVLVEPPSGPSRDPAEGDAS